MIEPKHADIVGRRRNVAVAGHRGDEATARLGLSDPSGDVRATALGALVRMGQLAASDVRTALQDPSPIVRARACEVSVGLVVDDIDEVLADSEPPVVESACYALGERGSAVGGRAVANLSLVATCHQDPLCREAAVAALGAIGHRSGLPAILNGLRDKAPIRRRAVLALAPFDGPEVEAALVGARTDRDWQVRQAAEDILEPGS